jgi:hypothetical protein
MYRVFGFIYPEYNYVHNTGFALTTDYKGYGFSVDAAYRLTEDRTGSRMDIKNNEILYNIQITKTFFKRLYAQVNFIHRYILFSDRRVDSRFSPVIQEYISGEIDTYLFQKDHSQIYILTHFDISFVNETLYLGINMIYGIAENEFYCAPRISYRINDYITLYTGADFWIGGSGDGYLSRNKLNDNFFVRIRFAI